MKKVKAFFTSGKVQKGLVIGGAILAGIYILGKAVNAVRGDNEADVWEEVEAGIEEESA